MDKETIAQIDKGPLKRVLGVTDLFAIGYGDLGSSIFYALGITALFALSATPLALLLAGIVFVCTALSYAEMSSTFHESGGSASYARHAFNDLISFVAGWALLLDYIVTIAISAFTIGPYLSGFFPWLQEPTWLIGFGIAVIGFLFFINYFGVKQSTRASFFLMLFILLTQVVIILIGLYFTENIRHVFQNLSIGKGLGTPSWHDFIRGTAMAMVAYTGIESIAQLGAETRRPAHTVPKAIIITMFILVAIYFGLSTVALGVLSPQELGKDYVQNPITGIVAHLPFASEILVPWVGILAAIVLFVAANAGLIGASRLSFNMGEYYQLPRFFHVIHPRYRTPYASLAFFGIIASIVIAMSHASMQFLADLYNFGAQIAFFSTHLSLIVLRIKKPHIRRPFKAPLNIPFGRFTLPLPAIIGALATLGVWLLVVITKPEGRYLGFAWLTFGLLMYFYYRRKARIPVAAQLTIEKVKIPSFQPVKIKNILLPARSGLPMETIQMTVELAKVHGAHLTAVYVVEVPFSLPLESVLPQRLAAATALLKMIEAIARDKGIDVDIEIVRSRSTADAILDILKVGGYDLVVLGDLKVEHPGTQKGLGLVSEQILREAACRVWIIGAEQRV
ncbi:MAG: amino acid permease [Verrucomicrobia bacterium]|nr:amino acid permease [Verrucomicrobiota bacterium]